VPFDFITGPRDGIAQVFLTFATLLDSDVDPSPLALVHARLASYIAPDMADARLMVAQMLQATGQFDAAEVEFNTLREKGQMRPLAELGRIDALARADRTEDATNAAIALTETRPEMAEGWIARGDLMRQQDKWAEAISAYDKAIALIDPADADALWFPLYARAIALERSGQFDRAEADLQAALKIRPDNAQMLNYLGYSYVDRGKNLDEALRLIQRAVELSPDDGYILDSLGWVLYRLGRYPEAVAPQERAVLAMSNDPLVNDHLGDIYWMVGRKQEAKTQWMRALSFKPESEDDIHRIRAKLDRGLDAVLAEEKANGGKLPPPPPEPVPEDGEDVPPPPE
jgi:tetratricopeptide (TPR) repeat protein